MAKTYTINLKGAVILVGPERRPLNGFSDDTAVITPTPGPYVNTGPEHMPLGLADRRAHDARLAERGERDES